MTDAERKAVSDFLLQLEEDIHDRIDGYVDTRDGSYGEPMPNDAMVFVSDYLGGDYFLGAIQKLRSLLKLHPVELVDGK